MQPGSSVTMAVAEAAAEVPFRPLARELLGTVGVTIKRKKKKKKGNPYYNKSYPTTKKCKMQTK